MSDILDEPPFSASGSFSLFSGRCPSVTLSRNLPSKCFPSLYCCDSVIVRTPALLSDSIRRSSRSVPFVPTATVAPWSFAFSAMR